MGNSGNLCTVRIHKRWPAHRPATSRRSLAGGRSAAGRACLRTGDGVAPQDARNCTGHVGTAARPRLSKPSAARQPPGGSIRRFAVTPPHATFSPPPRPILKLTTKCGELNRSRGKAMLIKKPDAIPSSEITPQATYLTRRTFLAGAAIAGAAAVTGVAFRD